MTIFQSPLGFKLISRKTILLAALTFMQITSSASAANYLIAPGDTIEISIVSLPELRQKVVVNMEGQVSYPLIGTLNVSGLTLSGLQQKLKNALTNKSVRSRAPDGGERTIYIYPEEISAVVVEHRPIYINGDVSKPGELTFRPGMTIRQAIALSGGMDPMRSRTGDPTAQAIDLQLEGRLLRTEYLRQKAIVSRLSDELNKTSDKKRSTEPPSLMESSSPVQRAQMEQLELALEDHRKEIESLARSIEQTQFQIKTLERLREELMQSYQQQASEVARLKSNFEKGLAPIARISEEQRALTFVSERLLQTEAQLTVARKGQEEQKRQLEKTGDQRRLKLMHDLEEAENKLLELQTKIQGTDEKLLYTGHLKSQLLEASEATPRLKIFRKNGNSWEEQEAQFDIEVMPGDIVEIMIPRNTLRTTQ
jgi:polysaccharide biosynthesis/export protein